MVASRSGRTVEAIGRLASVGALGFSITIPVVVLLLFALLPPYSHHFAVALAATAVYLPLHVRHVTYALRGVRPRGLPWTVLAMAVAIIAPTPVLGSPWLYAFHALAASLLITMRPRVSLPALACILVGVGIWGDHLSAGYVSRGDELAQGVYFGAAVLDRAMVVFVLVWLGRAVRRIQSMRRALAEQALQAERQRVDDELGATIGAQLERVVAQGQHALDAMRLGTKGAEEQLESLVQGSRSVLADARRLIARYKLVSSRAELEAAASLLRAAGMEVRMEVADEALPPVLDEPLRSSLRAAVAQLLADGATGIVELKVGNRDGASTFEAVPASLAERAA